MYISETSNKSSYQPVTDNLVEKNKDLAAYFPGNSVAASMIGFVSRILVERNFFQNTQIPAESLLYLANDLIKALSPNKAEQTLSLSREISLLWKQFRGQSLSNEEQTYLDTPMPLDVSGEILNGLKYSSMALLGNNLYHSISSAVTGKLWAHIPSICGYFGAVAAGPHAVAWAAKQVLEKNHFTETQKVILEPWLNMVGKLALGLMPKVHATDQGVHYHYPSLEGHTQTVSSHQRLTLKGDEVTVERPGSLHTPEGTFEGVYQSQFRLNRIDEISEEHIRIQVLDETGTPVPVVFSRRTGQYGPEISVFSVNKALEERWSQYFHPQQHGARGNVPLQLQEGLSARNNLLMASLDRTQETFIKNEPSNSAIQPHAWLPFLSTLLLPKFSTSRSLISNVLPFLTLGFSNPTLAWDPFGAKKAAKEAGHQGRLTIEQAGKVAKEVIVELFKFVDESGEKFVARASQESQLVIHQVGEELRVTAKGFEEATNATLRVAGSELNFAIAALGKESIATIKYLGETANLVIDKGGGVLKEIVGQIEQVGDKMTVNFGQQGELLITKAGETFQLKADAVLQKAFDGSQATLKIADRHMEMRIQQAATVIDSTLNTFFQNLDHQIDHLDHITTQVMDRLEDLQRKMPGTAGALVLEMLERFKQAINLNTPYGKVLNDIKQLVVNSSEKMDILVCRLLNHVRDQNQGLLSASEKANLYAELISIVNIPSLDEHVKKWLWFVIVAVAVQDDRLKEYTNSYFGSSTKNHFETIVIPAIPDTEIRNAFSANEFSVLKEQCDIAIATFSERFKAQNIKNDIIKTCPNFSHLSLDGEVPVGTVVAFASAIVPPGYIRCDGAYYSKDLYRELYRVLEGRCVETGNYFQIPDYSNVFLKGTTYPQNVGEFFKDTTAMPKNAFKAKGNGIHKHPLKSAGKHDHPMSLEGTHLHDESEAGSHDHALGNQGNHVHSLGNVENHKHDSELGTHKHATAWAGDHNHNNPPFIYMLKCDGHDTGCCGDRDRQLNEPNLFRKGEMRTAGGHAHDIPVSGEHSHAIKEAGTHSHSVEEKGGHIHNVSLSQTHKHTLSSAGPHTHSLSAVENHAHDVENEGEHLHEIVGGDEETNPPHRKIAYIIKAKNTGNLVTRYQNLLNEVEVLKKNQSKSEFWTNSALIGLAVLVVGGFVFPRN